MFEIMIRSEGDAYGFKKPFQNIWIIHIANFKLFFKLVCRHFLELPKKVFNCSSIFFKDIWYNCPFFFDLKIFEKLNGFLLCLELTVQIFQFTDISQKVLIKLGVNFHGVSVEGSFFDVVIK